MSYHSRIRLTKQTIYLTLFHQLNLSFYHWKIKFSPFFFFKIPLTFSNHCRKILPPLRSLLTSTTTTSSWTLPFNFLVISGDIWCYFLQLLWSDDGTESVPHFISVQKHFGYIICLFTAWRWFPYLWKKWMTSL